MNQQHTEPTDVIYRLKAIVERKKERLSLLRQEEQTLASDIKELSFALNGSLISDGQVIERPTKSGKSRTKGTAKEPSSITNDEVKEAFLQQKGEFTTNDIKKKYGASNYQVNYVAQQLKKQNLIRIAGQTKNKQNTKMHLYKVA